jgi:hypothetical protein
MQIDDRKRMALMETKTDEVATDARQTLVIAQKLDQGHDHIDSELTKIHKQMEEMVCFPTPFSWRRGTHDLLGV